MGTGPKFPVSLVVILWFSCSRESGTPTGCGADEPWREMYQHGCPNAFFSGAPGDFDSGIGAGRTVVRLFPNGGAARERLVDGARPNPEKRRRRDDPAWA